MGIIINAGSIIFGSLIGSAFKNKISLKNNTIFGFCIIIMSTVSFLERIFSVNGYKIVCESLMVVIFCLLLGYILGEILKIDQRLCKVTSNENTDGKTGLITSSVYFAIGGMQITGSILLAIDGDSSVLIQKSLIDIPFAIIFGSIYGKSVSLSFLPVALVQGLIFIIAYFLGDFISQTCINEVCSIGYVLLFFSGYNLVVSADKKVRNLNMLPSILLIIVYNIIKNLVV